MTQLPPSRVKQIPLWIKKLLPEQVQRTGVLTVEDSAAINFGAIVPFVVLTALLFFIPPMLAFIFGASMITFGIIALVSIILALFWIKGILFQRVINVPLGWIGSVRFMNEYIHLAMATGSHMFWIPESLFGIKLLTVDFIPNTDISKEVPFVNIETFGKGKGATVVYVSGKTSKIWDIYDPIAASKYLVPQIDFEKEDSAEKAVVKLAQLIEDWYQSRIPEALGEVDGRNLSKRSPDSGRTILNDVFWEKILQVRNGGIAILKFTGVPFDHTTEDRDGNPITIRIETETPLAFVGSDTDKWVMHSPEELNYLRENFNLIGSHLLFPQWGIRLKSAWFHDPNPTDADVQKDLQSGARVQAKTKAYQNALEDLIKKAESKQPADPTNPKVRVPLTKEQLSNLQEIAKLISGTSSETRTFDTKSYPEIAKLAETLGPDIINAIANRFGRPTSKPRTRKP